MKILLLDTEKFEFKAIEPESSVHDEFEKGKSESFRDVLVGFVTLEKGDDDSVFDEVLSDVSDYMSKIGRKDLVIYPYAHLSDELLPSSQAIKLYNSLADFLKKNGINVIKAPFGWNKSYTVQIKGHPLAESLRTYKAKKGKKAGFTPKEKFYKFFVIDSEGNEYEIFKEKLDEYDFLNKDPALKRFVQNELIGKETHKEEPAHIKYMRKLELVDYCPESDIGHLKWFPKGVVIRDLILDYAEQLAMNWGAIKMQNPLIYRTDVEAIALLQGEFHERDYKIEGENMVLRFASDPGAFPFVQKVSLSYRQMPFKVYEEAQCFRKEQSGEVVGLMRVRSFLMTDHHAFCPNEEIARKEYYELSKLFAKLMNDIISGEHWVLGFEIVDEYYEKYKDLFKQILKDIKKPAFFKLMNRMTHYYAFKNEFQAIFPDGNNLQISTVQWDVKNGERFNLTYMNEEGKKIFVPIIIHASSFGSIERALASMLESAAWQEKEGNVPLLPFWLSPEQVRVLPVSSVEHLEYAEKIANEVDKKGFRVSIDDRDITLGKKVAEAKSDWIPVLVVVGAKEVQSGKLNVVNRIGSKIGKEPSVEMSTEDLLSLLDKLQAGMPKRKLSLNMYLSKRPKFI
ncbi:MAG: threonine--tRNA ligase [Nitrososphaeria archaeon]|jgi:Threonyl-tRNA synthetase